MSSSESIELPLLEHTPRVNHPIRMKQAVAAAIASTAPPCVSSAFDRMKRVSEGMAFLVAISVSTLVLLGTFGLAAVMRSHQPQTVLATAVIPPNDKRARLDLAAAGRHLFLMNCAHCHGDDALGDEGPNLHGLHKSDGRIHQVITAGIKGEMPSFGKKLNDSDIRALTAYLRTLS
jgi:mono/diheme cytochrome c family protein